MFRQLALGLALLIAATACTAGPPATIEGIREVRSEAGRASVDAAAEQARRAVVAADTAFALHLYRQLVAAEQGNVFFSPYSISTALSMTLTGARGNTAAELAAALGLSLEDLADWHAGRNALELALMAERHGPPEANPLVLSPTNAIFGQAGYPFEAAFLRTLAEHYGAGLQAVDFTTNPDAARQLINRWVNDRTRERIPNLLPEGSITELTRTVLVNAIYFKASWLYQFAPEATTDRPFTRLDGSTLTVPLMHGRLETSYAAGDGWQAVRLPYAGDASMLVIVPDTGSFATVEADLDAALLAEVRQALTGRTVMLDLPRWESASALNLIPVLEALGVTDLFVPGRADLSGIASVEELYVSGVVHQANVTVDEEGTEAAAATAVIAGTTSAGPPPVQLTVDRPFIYLITDDVTGEILFAGRVLDPAAG